VLLTAAQLLKPGVCGSDQRDCQEVVACKHERARRVGGVHALRGEWHYTAAQQQDRVPAQHVQRLQAGQPLSGGIRKRMSRVSCVREMKKCWKCDVTRDCVSDKCDGVSDMHVLE
jgi:hypothetical protein